MKLTYLFVPVAASLLLGCNNDDTSPPPPQPSPAEKVSIVYTAHGVPHIQAASYRALGYGVGVAQASENLCTLSEQLLKLKGEKSRYFGAGAAQKNLLSDLAYRALDYRTQARQLYGAVPLDSKMLMQGYAEGFNYQLRQFGNSSNYPTPCRGVSWVTQIQPEDLLAYYLDLASLASTRNFLAAMAVAAPPGQPTAVAPSVAASQVHATVEGIGSNGWALGKDKTDGAQSALLANPHFPWDGELRFFEQHLTIPGELDVTGVSMIGMPAVLIGFNQHLGWTHTVSQSKRFTLYQLSLDENNPLRYRYGTSYRDISAQKVSIEVLQPDQSIKTVESTLYRSHYGPMLDLTALSPALGWNQKTAITMRDANAGNSRMLQHWLAMGKARNKTEFFQAFSQNNGIPWVNTMMADSSGNAVYLDGSQVPQLSPAAEVYWANASKSPQLAPIWQDGAGNILLPGSDPAFEWQDSVDAAGPGLMPFAKAPKQERTDYVFNANSSHWLSNLNAPLEGFSLVYGPERTERSPRTRYNAQLISNQGAVKLAGEDGKFNFAELKSVFSHNGSLFGTELKTALAQRCAMFPQLQLPTGAVDLSAACQVLANWDGRYQLDSRGAHLLREFLLAYRIAGERNLDKSLYQTAFDADNAALTPAGLAPYTAAAPEQDKVLLALASAVQRLTQAGIALDAPLGTIQFVQKAQGQDKLPIAGGYSYEGLFNMSERAIPSRSTADLANVVSGTGRPDSLLSTLSSNGNSDTAYRVNYGSSFVMALQFTAEGPKADMMLAYSQSHDPASPFFADQTRLFSQGLWRPMLFRADEVKNATVKTITLTLEP
ncbi:penicillin acylase family protein [Rheinheimera sp.]|uniref:penicillin acylase family protein n=1 Tax=Rheinheimera sp. TaxID=1869214 RepID=UPI002FDD454D